LEQGNRDCESEATAEANRSTDFQPVQECPETGRTEITVADDFLKDFGMCVVHDPTMKLGSMDALDKT
jgi:hypothetical protein